MKKGLLVIVCGVFLLGACSPATPVKQFTRGDELAFYDFTSPTTFEEGLYGNGVARLQISSGVYNIAITSGDNTMYYGQWGDPAGDVVLDVEASQTSTDVNTTYGVMCRVRGTVGQTVLQNAEATEVVDLSSVETIAASPDAEATLDPIAEATSDATAEGTTKPAADATAEATTETTADATAETTAEATTEATSIPPTEVTAEATAEATADSTLEGGTSNAMRDNTTNNGDGYLFMVQGSGRYAIFRSQGRKLTPLVDWAASSVINTGAAQNRIRAVCMGTYLALYVNGQFLADATDDLYSTGQSGLVAAAAARTGMTVTFDNFMVSAAKPE